MHTEERVVVLLLDFLKRDKAQGGTSYNNNESA